MCGLPQGQGQGPRPTGSTPCFRVFADPTAFAQAPASRGEKAVEAPSACRLLASNRVEAEALGEGGISVASEELRYPRGARRLHDRIDLRTEAVADDRWQGPRKRSVRSMSVRTASRHSGLERRQKSARMRRAPPLLHVEAEVRADRFREVAFSEADAGRGYRECAPGAVAARCSRREAVRGLTRNGRLSTLDYRAAVRC